MHKVLITHKPKAGILKILCVIKYFIKIPEIAADIQNQ